MSPGKSLKTKQNNESVSEKNNGTTRLSEKVYDYILSRIAEGTFKPGSRINPKKIAEKLGLSGTPVRDALEKLEHQEWITRVPQSGTYIKNITLEEIDQIYEFRAILECQAVRLTVERINKEQFEALSDITAQLSHSAKANDIAQYEKKDTEFHKLLVTASGNKYLAQTCESVLARTRCLFIALHATTHGRDTITDLESTAVSHSKVLEAIIGKDADTAESLIKKHIEVACEWNKAVAKIRWLSETQ